MTDVPAVLDRARAGDPEAFAALVSPLRSGLLLHCYRMLASAHDAEDAVQETLVRAWRGLPGFEGRSSLRSWLLALATNVCLREIERRGRRLQPVDVGPASAPGAPPGEPSSATPWLGPLPEAGLAWEATPTDARYEQREAVELAFVAALQHLPALQRAVLILRDVLGFTAAETAAMLSTTVTAANSALHRARTTAGERLPDRSQQRVLRDVGDARVRATVEAFVRAWERHDVPAVVALLAEDVVMAMPPFAAWYDGREAVAEFLADGPLRPGRRWRLRITTASGQPAIAKAIWDDAVGGWLAHGLMVLSLAPDGTVRAVDAYLDPVLAA